MTIHTLASGSEGNCLLLSDGGVHLLLDAGISTRRIKAGLLQLGLTMADVDGVLITHEHSDHVSGLQTMVKHHRIPIYTSPGTARQLAYRIAGIESLLRPVEPGTVFSVGDCRVTVFRTSHDAAQSVDYRVDGSAAVGFLTDTGFRDPGGGSRSGGGGYAGAGEQPRRGVAPQRAVSLFPEGPHPGGRGASVQRCGGGVRRPNGPVRHTVRSFWPT